MKRIVYIYISFSLFLLLPSLYGIVYCFVSERKIEIVPLLEKQIDLTIDKFKTGEMIFQYDKFLREDMNDFTENPIWKHHNEIIYKCSDFSRAGFDDDELVHGYASFVIRKIDSEFTLSLRELGVLTYDLLLFLHETLGKEKELFSYSDDEEDEIGIELPLPGGDESEYTPLLRQRLLEEYGQRESLESRKTRAQENLNNHIAKLEEYLNAIKAARLAHEPHRPMIRFIGWFWLIFEIVGMVLLLCVAHVEVNVWKKR